MPNSPSQSLLQKAKLDPHSEAWSRLNRIYEPLIAGWIVRAGIAKSEVGDITQDVMQALFQDLPNFNHNGRVGAFRKWLKLISINRCRRYWDKKKREVSTKMPVESESSIGFLNSLEDPNSDNSLLWDKEHDNYILDKMIELVRAEFEKRDFDVFLRNAIEGQAAKELSKELRFDT